MDSDYPVAHELVLVPGRHRAALLDRDDLEQEDVHDVIQAIGVADERPALKEAQAKQQQRTANEDKTGEHMRAAASNPEQNRRSRPGNERRVWWPLIDVGD
jgi:hypothetical protein